MRKNTLCLMPIAAALTLALSACEQPDKTHVKINTGDNNTAAQTDSAQPVASNVVRVALPEFQPTGKISVVLDRGVDGVPDKPKYTKNSPPMPVIFSGLSVYQVGNQYRLYNKDLELDTLVGSANERTQIDIGQTPAMTTIFVNGDEVFTTENQIVSGKNVKLYSNGSGRDWHGTISALSACFGSTDCVVEPITIPAP